MKLTYKMYLEAFHLRENNEDELKELERIEHQIEKIEEAIEQEEAGTLQLEISHSWETFYLTKEETVQLLKLKLETLKVEKEQLINKYFEKEE